MVGKTVSRYKVLEKIGQGGKDCLIAAKFVDRCRSRPHTDGQTGLMKGD